MSVSTLVLTLTRRGVSLSARNDRLHIEAPVGTLTPDDKDALTRHKPEILALLAETPDPWPFDPTPIIEACRAPWPPRNPLLATWPVELRERWGRRSNALQDEGTTWFDAERQAFVELFAETRPPLAPDPTPC